MSGSFQAQSAWLRGAALLGVVLACGTCSKQSPPRESTPAPLSLAGVEYLAPLFRAEILAFRDRYPAADSIVLVKNGSALGMEELVNDEVDMSLLLRDLTDPEIDAAVQREGLQAFPVAWDAVAVIVNPASPIEQISRTELGAIYRGELTDWATLGWKRGGSLIALTPGPKVGVFAYLEQALLDGGTFAPTVYAPPDEQQVVDVVATRPNAIACVSRAFVDDRVRILRVSQARGLPYVVLDRETLLTKQYPLLRAVWIATSAKPKQTATDFINYVCGMDGQQIVARHGYAPAAVPIRIVRTAEEAP